MIFNVRHISSDLLPGVNFDAFQSFCLNFILVVHQVTFSLLLLLLLLQCWLPLLYGGKNLGFMYVCIIIITVERVQLSCQQTKSSEPAGQASSLQHHVGNFTRVAGINKHFKLATQLVSQSKKNSVCSNDEKFIKHFKSLNIIKLMN